MEICYESGDHPFIGAKEVGPGWTTPEMYFKSLLGHSGMARDTKTGWTNHLSTPPSLLELTIGQQRLPAPTRWLNGAQQRSGRKTYTHGNWSIFSKIVIQKITQMIPGCHQDVFAFPLMLRNASAAFRNIRRTFRNIRRTRKHPGDIQEPFG